MLVMCLLLIICLTACTKNVTAPQPEQQPSAPVKPEPKFYYLIDLNQLPEGFQFKYNDTLFDKQDLKLEYEFSNQQEKFSLVTKKYTEDYYFSHFKEHIPVESLCKELIRVNTPIEDRLPKPQSYTIHIPQGVNIEFRGSSYIGDNEYILLKDVEYHENFTVINNDFKKQFYFQTFDSNNTIKIKELLNYTEIKDVELSKTELGYKVEFPLQSNLTVGYNGDFFTINGASNTIAYANKQFKTIEVTYPKHFKPAIANVSKKYAYMENSYLVVRDKNGMLISRTYLGKGKVVCEKLVWSPNEKYLFAVLNNTGQNEKFYLFNTKSKKLIAIGGSHINYFGDISWAPNSSGIAFYKVEHGYSEITVGEHLYYNLASKKLQSLKGGYRDKIKWINNRPQLVYNNKDGLRFEIYDPKRDEFRSDYEQGSEPQYPNDFMGTLLKIYDKDDNELVSFNLLDLFKEHNIAIPENTNMLLPYVDRHDVKDFLYFSVDWKHVSIDDQIEGIEPITNVIGFINLKDMSLQFIDDFTDINYYYNNGDYRYVSSYQVDTSNNLIYYYKVNKVDIYDVETKQSMTYELPSNAKKNTMHYYKDILFITTDNSILAIGPNKTITIYESKQKFNYTLTNNQLSITIRAIESDKQVTYYNYYNLDDIIKNEFTD